MEMLETMEFGYRSCTIASVTIFWSISIYNMLATELVWKVFKVWTFQIKIKCMLNVHVYINLILYLFSPMNIFNLDLIVVNWAINEKKTDNKLIKTFNTGAPALLAVSSSHWSVGTWIAQQGWMKWLILGGWDLLLHGQVLTNECELFTSPINASQAPEVPINS